MYLSIWRAEPDRVRVAIAGGLQDGSVGVRVGERWWSMNPAQGTRTNADSPAQGWFGEGAESFLLPDALLTSLRFEDRGHDDRAGRPVVVAAAFPSGGQRPVPPVLGMNADRYLVEVDLDCGLVLSVHAYLDDKPFQTIDVVELLIENVDSDLFDGDPPSD
jgi:hypothetical protein